MISEPTNVLIKHMPSSWNIDKLRQVFGVYGNIRQIKVIEDGYAFLRFEQHDDALNAIDKMDKQLVEEGYELEAMFATRKKHVHTHYLDH